MFTILAFKVWQPNGVGVNRGNHEAEMANHFYGFFGELEVKYEKRMTEPWMATGVLLSRDSVRCLCRFTC